MKKKKKKKKKKHMENPVNRNLWKGRNKYGSNVYLHVNTYAHGKQESKTDKKRI